MKASSKIFAILVYTVLPPLSLFPQSHTHVSVSNHACARACGSAPRVCAFACVCVFIVFFHFPILLFSSPLLKGLRGTPRLTTVPLGPRPGDVLAVVRAVPAEDDLAVAVNNCVLAVAYYSRRQVAPLPFRLGFQEGGCTPPPRGESTFGVGGAIAPPLSPSPSPSAQGPESCQGKVGLVGRHREGVPAVGRSPMAQGISSPWGW